MCGLYVRVWSVRGCLFVMLVLLVFGFFVKDGKWYSVKFFQDYMFVLGLFKRGRKIQFFGNRGNSVLENDGLRPMTLDMSEVEIISSSDSSTTISDTNTTTEATTPKTGDNSDLYVWYIILAAAIYVKSHIPDIFPDI